MNNNVFKIKRVTVSDVAFYYTAEINNSHPVFEGHFPQMPVVPGVCTMSMLKQCLSDAMSREVRYDYIKECKFLLAIIPSEHKTLDVNIHVKQEDDEVNISAEVTFGEMKMMKLKATLA